jgi:plastocyanin
VKSRLLVALFVLGCSTSARAAVNGCGLGSSAVPVDLRGRPSVTVAFGGVFGFAYSPACIRIVAGTAVTFSGNFAPHPLRAGTADGGIPIPDPTSPIQSTDTGTTATFNFPSSGEFGYYCNAHWPDAMYGGILVEPDLIFGDGFETMLTEARLAAARR